MPELCQGGIRVTVPYLVDIRVGLAVANQSQSCVVIHGTAYPLVHRKDGFGLQGPL